MLYSDLAGMGGLEKTDDVIKPTSDVSMSV